MIAICGIPVHLMANHYFLGTGAFYIMMFSTLWGLGGLIAIFALIPIGSRYWEYLSMERDHKKFLKKYHREI
jgi:hypothetical protein